MEILKIVLLTIAYSLGIATLIVQIICYLKELEYKETIIFSIAFLLLIVTSTIQSIVKTDDFKILQFQELAINLLTVLFSISIPINIHKERADKYRNIRNRIVIIIGVMVAIFTALFHSFNYPILTVIVISIHLFLSVVYSMFFVLFTKPESLIQFREKSERLIALMVLVIMTISLVFVIVNAENISSKLMQQNGGIILAIICIILSANKIPGDIKKFIHKETIVATNESKINMLGITQREHEVLLLLITGKTYKEIAADLFISLPTVKTHVSNIYSKAQVRNRLELSNLVK